MQRWDLPTAPLSGYNTSQRTTENQQRLLYFSLDNN